ncbi:MAG TPA: PQQ-binding-like beta-propeller repeat protein [Acidimicrobiales bacterium]|nr:PQQ-binding-like beta-propeller repeat protein [Acidimicrobiales bacterium]
MSPRGGRRYLVVRAVPVVVVLGVVAALVGLLTLGTTPFSPPTASTPPLALTQSWIQDLNDAPCGTAEASPVNVAIPGSGPGVEVGDRSGHIYAFGLANGAVPSGWSSAPPSASVGSGAGCGITGNDGATATPVPGVNGISIPENPPIDSTASVATTPEGNILAFGAGNAADPTQGGYYAYSADGQAIWNHVAPNPSTDPQADIGIQASPSLVTAGTTPFVFAGTLGQESDALNATQGTSLTGWPFFSADSVFSTAAVADLYGTGADELVVGGASTGGFADGRHYENGGHLRILNDHGGLICSANANEEIDSSPAIGPILPGGTLGIVTGTGNFYNATDEDAVKVFDTQCNQVWSQTLDGTTGSSPALADVEGNGTLAVVEGTNQSNQSGSVWALDATTGSTIWKVPVNGAVIGSVTTADLSGNGVQDVVVATTGGLEVLDGRTGAELVHADDGSGDAGVAPGKVFGFQNSPLITDDPDGSIGITVAGYFAIAGSPDHDVQGMVQHFTVNDSSGRSVSEFGGWPQFHHDPTLSGYTGKPTAQPTGCLISPAALGGYLTVASDGGVFAFGDQPYCGSTGSVALNEPIIGMSMSPDHGGYWLAGADGGVFAFGVPFYGSAADMRLDKPIVGLAATPDGAGYWLVAGDGGVFTYGDAQYFGSAVGQRVVGMASSLDGQGYWEVTANGAVYAFGDAGYFGGVGQLHLAAPIVDITPDPATGGYWLIASNGGVFSFDAPFFGATGPIPLNRPIVGMQATDDGGGYWIVAADGGVFTYGDAPYEGSDAQQALNRPIVGIVGY